LRFRWQAPQAERNGGAGPVAEPARPAAEPAGTATEPAASVQLEGAASATAGARSCELFVVLASSENAELQMAEAQRRAYWAHHHRPANGT
jgi:hypothetical protein